MPTTEQITHGYDPRPWQAEVHTMMASHRYNVIIVHARERTQLS